MSRGDAVTRKLVTFGRILREAGLEVGPGRLKDAIQGLDAIDLADRDEVYQALCCTLVSRRDDLPVFDAAFRAFWDRAPVAPGEAPTSASSCPPPQAPPRGRGAGADRARRGRGRGRAGERSGVASPDELLRRRDFAGMTPDELRRLRRLMDDLASLHPLRRSRRLAPAHGGGVLDARRTLRQALRTGGLPLQRSWRRPKLVPRKLVVLCDVSGSMEPYARALIMFLQALAARDGAARHVEVFAFGTRLTG